MKNEELLAHFYLAFKNRDYKSMGDCYHAEAEFSDPVFPDLKGKQVPAMWHMLVSGGKETKISFSDIRANDIEGSCRWEATYPYGKKRRMVHNVVTSHFQFRDGKIFKQRDTFDLRAWLTMALGTVGFVLGWTAFLQKSVRQLAAKRLANFISAHPEYKI